MRIALFTDSYLPNTDGVVSSILALKKGIERRGHSYEIFAPDAPGSKPEKEVHRYFAVKFPPYPQYRAAVFPYVPASMAEKTGVKVVHSKAMMSMGVSAMSFAGRARLPSMASLETMISDGVHYLTKNKKAQEMGRKIAWGYLKWLYSHFDTITAPSRHTQGLMAENSIDSIVLPSPVDTSFFKPNKNGIKVRRGLGLERKKIILTVGRVVKEKNYLFFAKVAKVMRDPDVVFLISGQGPYLEEFKSEIEKMGVKDRFVISGFLPREKLVDYYNAGDVFLFASPFETQGLVQLEAMACGTPACILEGTAPAEAIREGKNGHTFPGEPNACAERILACIEKRAKFSGEARKTVEKDYSIGPLGGRLSAEYAKLSEMKGR
ncbi:TPA: glycosyltransferase family 4 protein [Candidatus Micrarchaeota archaeon]|nr:glycosyltransferase family 4 protein [Candidatus Micrarchaeota archaeon]HIH30882.1 glycosyltransferase family 4 protein [Candidatus Micrarchaeota archaeon]